MSWGPNDAGFVVASSAARSEDLVTVNGETVQGLTVDTPPAQPNGGGVASDQSVSVAFLFYAVQGGSYSFGYNVEALPQVL